MVLVDQRVDNGLFLFFSRSHWGKVWYLIGIRFGKSHLQVLWTVLFLYLGGKLWFFFNFLFWRLFSLCFEGTLFWYIILFLKESAPRRSYGFWMRERHHVDVGHPLRSTVLNHGLVSRGCTIVGVCTCLTKPTQEGPTQVRSGEHALHVHD